jgi:hypothetical protein
MARIFVTDLLNLVEMLRFRIDSQDFGSIRIVASRSLALVFAVIVKLKSQAKSGNRRQQSSVGNDLPALLSIHRHSN